MLRAADGQLFRIGQGAVRIFQEIVRGVAVHVYFADIGFETHGFGQFHELPRRFFMNRRKGGKT